MEDIALAIRSLAVALNHGDLWSAGHRDEAERIYRFLDANGFSTIGGDTPVLGIPEALRQISAFLASSAKTKTTRRLFRITKRFDLCRREACGCGNRTTRAFLVRAYGISLALADSTLRSSLRKTLRHIGGALPAPIPGTLTERNDMLYHAAHYANTDVRTRVVRLWLLAVYGKLPREHSMLRARGLNGA